VGALHTSTIGTLSRHREAVPGEPEGKGLGKPPTRVAMAGGL
jgi:hypothetical protein